MANEQNKNDSNFLIALNWSALLVMLSCLIALIILAVYLLQNNGSPIKYEVKVVTNTYGKDSLKSIKIEEYLNQLKESITTLNSSENLIEKRIDEINSFYKVLGTIIAIILAIAGFFGFKSLQELKIKNLEHAKDVAIREARINVESLLQNLKEITLNKINEAKLEATLSMSAEHYKSVTKTEAIEGNYIDLKSRLDNIERLESNYVDLTNRLKSIEKEVFKTDINSSTDETKSEEKKDKEKDLLNENDPFEDNKINN